MKNLLTTTALSILLVSLASVSYGQTVETRNYPNGAVYVGEVSDYRYNGQGTYTFADGSVQNGIWRDNELITENDN